MNRYFWIILFIIAIGSTGAASTKDWKREESKARDLYNSGKFDEAVILLREIILSSDNDVVKRESFFWISMTYMNIGKLSQAETNLEYYLANFGKNGQNYGEAVYQKGRLLFLQEEYELSIKQLSIFVNEYQNHPLVSNGYYWIGESLYALGQFEDSEFYFNIVISKYKKSNKYEASIYKIRLIEHKKSELALQNLLKWSQEEYLEKLAQFRIKEKSLLQVITELEKNGGASINIAETDEYKKLLAKNDILQNKITELEQSINSSKDASSDLYNQKVEQMRLREETLKKQEEALRLLDIKLREKEKELENL